MRKGDVVPRTVAEIEDAIARGLAPEYSVDRGTRKRGVAADPHARWDFREDRLELERWLDARRAGYTADPDPLTGGVTLTVTDRGRDPWSDRAYRGPTMCWRFTWQELRSARLGWRWCIARALRDCRAEVRRYREPQA